MKPFPALRGKRETPTLQRASLVAVILTLAACTPAQEVSVDTETAQATVSDQQSHLDALDARFEQLEQALQPILERRDAVENLASISTQIAALEARIDALASAVDDERDARLTFGQQLDASQADLRETMAELRDGVLELRALIEDLEIRYTILQRRIDQLQQ